LPRGSIGITDQPRAQYARAAARVSLVGTRAARRLLVGTLFIGAGGCVTASTHHSHRGFYCRATGNTVSAHVLSQERERLFVEGRHVLVKPRVRAVLEDMRLRLLDAVLQRFGEPGRANHVVAPEGDLCRSTDLAELRLRVVIDHCVRYLDERVERLLGAAAHEVGQTLDVIR